MKKLLNATLSLSLALSLLSPAAHADELSNAEKALALIGTFASGDTALAASLLRPDYIQHNPDYATGRDAFIQALAGLHAPGVPETTVDNIRAFEDGDYVFLHTVYNFAGSGKQAAFDVFRFQDGLIAEHWDNLAALAAPNPSGHTQVDGATEVQDEEKTEENRRLVKDFVSDILMGSRMEKLADYFNGDHYIQHNSSIADGVSGLGAALQAMAEQGIAMVYEKNHLVLAQGNFVLSLSEGQFAGEHVAFYDLFRVENGKIAEHWDIISPIPPQGDHANSNGKF